jgi:hypothetical protein
MSLQRPTASVQLGGSDAALPSLLGGGPLSAAQAGIRRLRVDLSVDEAHDRVEVWLWKSSSLADAEPGAALTVGLGYGDEATDVLAAEVAGVDATPWGAVLVAFAPSRRLSSTFVGRSYVDRTVADVAEDLLGEAEVDVGEIDAPLQLPAFHVDPRRTVWGTLHLLARRTGHQIVSTAEGAVSFTPIPGATSGGGLLGAAAAAASALGLASSTTLREGADLMEFCAGSRNAPTALEVVTPSGGSGSTWYLLAAEPDPGSGQPVLVDSVMRTREAADAATTSYAAAASRATKTATLTVPGDASLRAGAPVSARDEDYRLLRVRHVMDTDAGYTCDLLLEGAK